MKEYYTQIEQVYLEKFRMARYVIISPQPENDVNHYMEEWAKKSGLLEVKGYAPRLIGWDFPFVTEEQQSKFGLRGYVAAYIVPDEFVPSCDGVELTYQDAGDYARIRIKEPFLDPFERIPGGYQEIFKYLEENGMKVPEDGVRSCFEEVMELDGITYMDVYMPVESK